jgi:hypothetical protein
VLSVRLLGLNRGLQGPSSGPHLACRKGKDQARRAMFLKEKAGVERAWRADYRAPAAGM